LIEGVHTYCYWNNRKGKVVFRLTENLTINGIDIPMGYETDFASVPRLFWSIIPTIGKHSIAALVHDYLYDNRIGSRREADRLFLELMLQYNVNKLSAYIMYAGVRIGALNWWRK
jgi:hypothetical protein